jgi:glucose-1-phosphatase
MNLVYQSTDQLRNITMLNLQNPPMIFPLKLKGLNTNADGLYTFEDINARFTEAMNAYDAIK